MMALTHSAIAAAAVGFSLSSTDPLVMGVAILGSQLPDLDTSTSLIGQICFPVSRWLENRFPHRTLTHCFWATGAIALLSLLLWRIGLDWKAAAALPFGHLTSCFSDTFTKQGVQLFFPAPAWCVFGSNPNRRLTTGGVGEYWVLAAAIAMLALNFHLTGSGGILRVAGQSLGLKSEAIATYNANAVKHHMYALIEGVRASDRAHVSGKFWILGTSGSEYVVTNGKEVYKTGEQIITNRVVIEPGAAATNQTFTLTFDDEDPLPTLEALQKKFPNSPIYLSGTLSLDLPEQIKITIDHNTMPTAVLEGSNLKQEFNSLEKSIQLLKHQHVTGQLQAKIFSSKGL